jgi:hypothetical protein
MKKAVEKFNPAEFITYSELPLNQFDDKKLSIYVLDKEWNYLYVNDFVRKNLDGRSKDMLGNNMWKAFPELSIDSAFAKLKTETEQGRNTDLVTTSPLTGQRLNIKGFVLSDCFLFFATVLPDKSELLNELRSEMRKPKK